MCKWISFNSSENKKRHEKISKYCRLYDLMLQRSLHRSENFFYYFDHSRMQPTAPPRQLFIYADTLYMRRTVSRSRTFTNASIARQSTVQDENSVACIFLGVHIHIAIHSMDAALDKCTEEKCLQWKSREIVFEAHFLRFLLHSNSKRLSILFIIIIGLLTQEKVCAAFTQSFSLQRREKIWHEKNDCISNEMAFLKPIKLWPLRLHVKRSQQLHARWSSSPCECLSLRSHPIELPPTWMTYFSKQVSTCLWMEIKLFYRHRCAQIETSSQFDIYFLL